MLIWQAARQQQQQQVYISSTFLSPAAAAAGAGIIWYNQVYTFRLLFFILGFTRDVRQFFVAILGVSVLQGHCVLLSGVPSSSFLSVSKGTLGSLSLRFWAFSVLQGHGVLLSGAAFAGLASSKAALNWARLGPT